MKDKWIKLIRVTRIECGCRQVKYFGIDLHIGIQNLLYSKIYAFSLFLSNSFYRWPLWKITFCKISRANARETVATLEIQMSLRWIFLPIFIISDFEKSKMYEFLPKIEDIFRNFRARDNFSSSLLVGGEKSLLNFHVSAKNVDFWQKFSLLKFRKMKSRVRPCRI